MTISIRYWLLPLIITLISIAIACLGETGRLALRYLGPGPQFGLSDVSYRWLTGHFTHIGWRHVGLNLAGLLSIWALYGRVITVRAWLGFLLVCPLGISLGLSLLSPQTAYYIGLSGVLHGMLALAVTTALIEPSGANNSSPAKGFRLEELIILAGLWGKIIYEQTLGAVPMTAALSGDAVVVNAHLYGAVIGTVFAALRRAYGLLTVKFSHKLTRPD